MPLVVVPIGAIVLALAALLFCFAFAYMIHNGVGVPLSQIPGVGGIISSALDGAINAVVDAVVGAADSAVHAIADILFSSGTYALQLWDMTAGLAEDVAGGFSHLIMVTLPAQQRDTLNWAAQLAAEAEGRAELLATRIGQDAASALAAVRDTLTGAIDADFHSLVDYIQAVAGMLQSDLSALEQSLLGALQRSQDYLITALGGEIARAQQEEAAILAEARHEITAVWDATESLVTDVAGRVEHEAILRDAAIAAAAAAATEVVATHLDDWLRDCGDPLCDGLSGLAKVLPLLTQLLATGALLAAVGEAIRDPRGAAHAAVELAQPFIDTAVSTIDDIGGL